MLNRPDYKIIRDLRKASKSIPVQAAGQRGAKLNDISKFTGYNQDVVAWAIARFPEFAAPNIDACFTDVQSNHEVLFKVQGSI